MIPPAGPVVVTGANSGIGLFTALVLAKRGFPARAGCRTPGRADELRDRSAVLPVAVVPLDVTEPGQIRAVARDVGVLVNAAGLDGSAAIERTPEPIADEAPCRIQEELSYSPP